MLDQRLGFNERDLDVSAIFMGLSAPQKICLHISTYRVILTDNCVWPEATAWQVCGLNGAGGECAEMCEQKP